MRVPPADVSDRVYSQATKLSARGGAGYKCLRRVFGPAMCTHILQVLSMLPEMQSSPLKSNCVELISPRWPLECTTRDGDEVSWAAAARSHIVSKCISAPERVCALAGDDVPNFGRMIKRAGDDLAAV